MSIFAAATTDRAALLRALEQGPAVLVTVSATRGSVPRESGAWLALGADRLLGSVGGGVHSSTGSGSSSVSSSTHS